MDAPLQTAANVVLRQPEANRSQAESHLPILLVSTAKSLTKLPRRHLALAMVIILLLPLALSVANLSPHTIVHPTTSTPQVSSSAKFRPTNFTAATARVNMHVSIVLERSTNKVTWEEKMRALQQAMLESLDGQTYQRFQTQVVYPSQASMSQAHQLLRMLGQRAVPIPLEGHATLGTPKCANNLLCIRVSVPPHIQLMPWFLEEIVQTFQHAQIGPILSSMPAADQFTVGTSNPDEWSNVLQSSTDPIDQPNEDSALVNVQVWCTNCSIIAVAALPVRPGAAWTTWNGQASISAAYSWKPQKYPIDPADFSSIGIPKRTAKIEAHYLTAATLRSRWHWLLDVNDTGLHKPIMDVQPSQMKYKCNPALYIAQGSGETCVHSNPSSNGSGACDPWSVEVRASQLRVVIKLSSYAYGVSYLGRSMPMAFGNMRENSDGIGFSLGSSKILFPADESTVTSASRGLSDTRVQWGDDAQVEGAIVVVNHNGFTMNFRYGDGSITRFQSLLRDEKNWAFLPGCFAWHLSEAESGNVNISEYRWAIHQLAPYTIIRIHMPTGNTSIHFRLTTQPAFKTMSSSTAAIPFIWHGTKGYLMIIHIKTLNVRYVHRFLFLSQDGLPRHVSQSFTLVSPARNGAPLVYIHSIMAATDAVGRKQLYIGYGYNDMQPWVAAIDIRELDNLTWRPVKTTLRKNTSPDAD
jgi:hypothetical protein